MVTEFVATPNSKPYSLPYHLRPRSDWDKDSANNLKEPTWLHPYRKGRPGIGMNEMASIRNLELYEPQMSMSDLNVRLARLSLSNTPIRLIQTLSRLTESNARITNEPSTPQLIAESSVPSDVRQVMDRIHRFQNALKEEDPDACVDDRPTPETAQRAIAFVLKASRTYLKSTGLQPPAPAISPGPDGSVDVVWRSGERVLAANIPAPPANVVTFYGRNLEGDEPRLSTEVAPNSDGFWALAWLSRVA